MAMADEYLCVGKEGCRRHQRKAAGATHETSPSATVAAVGARGELDVSQPQGGGRGALEHLLKVDRGEGGANRREDLPHESAVISKHSLVGRGQKEVHRGQGRARARVGVQADEHQCGQPEHRALLRAFVRS